MRLDKAAVAMLGVTALAWSIPFAQSAGSRQPGVTQPQAKVLLSGFVADEEQKKKKALRVASTVAGVQDVKDGIATRK